MGFGKSLEKCPEKMYHNQNQSRFWLRKCFHNIHYLVSTAFIISLKFTKYTVFYLQYIIILLGLYYHTQFLKT